MDLSIIIVNYKERGFLRQCLKGIRRVQPKLLYEVIVVDNASGDGSIEMVREHFPEVILFPQTVNLGLAKANNIGLRAAVGKYVLIMNTDLSLMSGAIEKMFAFMENHPEVGVVGPRLLNPDRTIQTSCYRFPTPFVPILRRTPLGRLPFARRILRQYLMLDWDHDHDRPVEWVLGACMMVRRQAIEEIGLMDEQFFVYFEDVDWCRRFWRRGWKVYYLASAQIVHYHQRMSAESPGLNGVFQKLTRIHINSGMKYFRKYLHQPHPEVQA